MKLIKKNEEYLLLGEKIGNSDKAPLVDFTPTVKTNGSWYILLASSKKHLNSPLIDEKQVSELIEAIEIDRIERLADKYADIKMDAGQGFDLVSGWRKLFKEGYTQALEDNSEKKFSLNQTFAICRLMFSNDYRPKSEDNDERGKEFQESFNKISSHFLNREQKNEWEVEIEMEVVPDFESRSRDNDGQISNGMKKEIIKITNGFVIITSIK